MNAQFKTIKIMLVSFDDRIEYKLGDLQTTSEMIFFYKIKNLISLKN